MNYFAILGLPINFSIENEELEYKYHNKYLIFHQNEQNEKIAELNMAYQVLSEPSARALHILELHKIDIDNFSFDAYLLEDIYKINEEIDKCTNEKELLILAKKNEQTKDSIIPQMEKAYVEELLSDFAKYTIKLKYVERILERIKTNIITINESKN